jgi:hypothetical protein
LLSKVKSKAKEKVDSSLEEITLSLSQKRVLDTIMQRKSVFFTGAAGYSLQI